MIFDDSIKLIKAIEQRVLNLEKTDIAIIDYLNRQLIYPFKILFNGYKLIGNDFLKFGLISIICIFIVGRVMHSMPAPLFNLIFLIVMLIPMVISLFPTPSIYCSYKVDAKLVNFARETLTGMNIGSEKTIIAIESNINLYESRLKNRISFLKGSVYALWGLILYFLNIVISHSIQIDREGLLEYFYYFIGLVIFYMAILCYEKVNDIIFKTAILGCTEYKASM